MEKDKIRDEIEKLTDQIFMIMMGDNLSRTDYITIDNLENKISSLKKQLKEME